MRITFLGDVGIPGPVTVPAGALAATAESDLVVANLEGAILEDEERRSLTRRATVALHNSPAVLDALSELGVGCVGLANNHVHDYDAPLDLTRSRLAERGIGAFGAGESLEEAASPFVVSGAGTTVKLFAFGWPVIGCRPAGSGSRGVAPLVPRVVLDTARRARAADADALIIFLMHWNYELELYPQPAHRQLAASLVEAGVDAVVGGHPHVAGGVELLGGKPVAYSLGNWLFPPRDVDGFELSYPPVARRQLALELEVEGREVRAIRLRWYDYDPGTGRMEAGPVEGLDGPIVTELTPFEGLSHDEYVRWFRDHRTRRRGLPVYAHYAAATNVGRDAYLRARRGAGAVLARLGLKGEQRRSPGAGEGR